MSCQPTHNGIIFLYKLVSGASPSSFGLEVAKMADLPDNVVALARDISAEFQKTIDLRSKSPETLAVRLQQVYQLVSQPLTNQILSEILQQKRDLARLVK
jgi:DNA mismatch repair ATPase MutS